MLPTELMCCFHSYIQITLKSPRFSVGKRTLRNTKTSTISSGAFWRILFVDEAGVFKILKKLLNAACSACTRHLIFCMILHNIHYAIATWELILSFLCFQLIKSYFRDFIQSTATFFWNSKRLQYTRNASKPYRNFGGFIVLPDSFVSTHNSFYKALSTLEYFRCFVKIAFLLHFHLTISRSTRKKRASEMNLQHFAVNYVNNQKRCWEKAKRPNWAQKARYWVVDSGREPSLQMVVKCFFVVSTTRKKTRRS